MSEEVSTDTLEFIGKQTNETRKKTQEITKSALLYLIRRSKEKNSTISLGKNKLNALVKSNQSLKTIEISKKDKKIFKKYGKENIPYVMIKDKRFDSKRKIVFREGDLERLTDVLQKVADRKLEGNFFKRAARRLGIIKPYKSKDEKEFKDEANKEIASENGKEREIKEKENDKKIVKEGREILDYTNKELQEDIKLFKEVTGPENMAREVSYSKPYKSNKSKIISKETITRDSKGNVKEKLNQARTKAKERNNIKGNVKGKSKVKNKIKGKTR